MTERAYTAEELQDSIMALQLKLTAAEEQVMELRAELTAIREAPLPEMPKRFAGTYDLRWTGKESVDVYLNSDVRNAFTALTQQVAALKHSRDTWKKLVKDGEAVRKEQAGRLNILEESELHRIELIAENAQLKAKGDGWIAVTDRLPGEDEEVLTINNFRCQMTGAYCGDLGWFTRGGGFLEEMNRKMPRFTPAVITHWHPLLRSPPTAEANEIVPE